MISLALLLRNPVKPDVETIRRLAARAFHTPFVSDRHAEHYVVRDKKQIAMRHGEYLLGIFHDDRRYWEDESFPSRFIGDPLIGQAVDEHCAWISADCYGSVQMRTISKDRKPEIYRILSKLILQLLDWTGEDCLALAVPESRHLFLQAHVREMLETKNPMIYLAPTGPVQMDDNDPRIQAAEAEAKRRMPEFLAAFQSRGPIHGAFWLKYTFTDPNGGEQMWVQAESIEDGEVVCQLQSEPSIVKTVHLAQRLTLKFEDAVDFMYYVNGKKIGGFVDEVIRGILEGG